MNRRTFLEESAAAAAVIGLAPFLAGAEVDGWSEEHVEGFLDRLERRTDHAREHGRRVWQRGDPDREASAFAEALAEAWPSVLAVTTIGGVPLEVQSHPAVQAVLLDHLEVVGRSVETLRDELRELRDALPDDEPPGDTLDRVEEELGTEDLPPQVRRRLRHALERAGWDVEHRSLRTVLDEQLTALDRLLALAARPEEALAAVTLDDPAAVEAVRRGVARGRTSDRPGAPTARIVAGVLVLGLGVMVGFPLIIVGIEAMSCWCIGLPILLFGTSLLVGGVVAGSLLLRSPPNEVEAGRGWVRTGVTVGPGTHVVTATGDFRLGADEIEPLVSGLPLGALIGRVHDETFAVEPGKPLQPSRPGVLFLAVNVAKRSHLKGGFSFRIEPAS
ncbi:MAG: hypothetical protein H6738_25690 [Alphaproteobacteria bacterium]|nr:hypothetical protein [Alphaproteobacteria bacterium]